MNLKDFSFMLMDLTHKITTILAVSFSTLSLAAENPIKIGNQLTCVGSSDGGADHDDVRVVLQNSDSFRITEDTTPVTIPVVYLKSTTTGGRWFKVVPIENGERYHQSIWIYQSSNNRHKLLLQSQFGALLALSSERPRLEIKNPQIKFDLYLSYNQRREIIMQGYLAVKRPNANTPLITQDIVCNIVPAVKQ